jgi:translin
VADAGELDLSVLEEVVRADLDAKYGVRELALKNCRQIIRSSANAIRALHRDERQEAERLLGEVRRLIAESEPPLHEHQDIYHAGFFSDAVKEYAEAEITRSLLAGEELPLPAAIGVHTVPYLKGLGEAVGELRRRLLDQLRTGLLDEAEATFRDMETVQDLLTSLDYPDGMTAGLRRTTDVARALIERSRADLTTTIVQERLRAQLERD